MEDFFASLKDVVVDDGHFVPVEDGWKGDWTYFQPGHTPWNKGKKGTCTEIQRQKARENALKRNANQKGANNRNAKTWHVTYADGKEITVKSIYSWAKSQGYSKSGIHNLKIKKWNYYKDLVSIVEVAQEAPTAP